MIPQATGAVILGVEYQALGLLRQLSAEGVRCALVDQDRWGPARFSRHRAAIHHSPSYQSKEFWPWLKSLAQRQGYVGWILIPTDDEQVRQMAEHFEEAQSLFRCAGLPWSSYQHLYNKRLAASLARDLRIAIPKTFLPEPSQPRPPAGELDFPFIIKPAFKREFSKRTNKKALVVDGPETLDSLLAGPLCSVPLTEMVYQEIIPGGGETQWSYAGFFVKGAPVAAFTARRQRQKPPDFGRASTYVVAAYDAEVERESLRLLAHLQYTGLAEVEWKRGSRDGVLRFLEVNARSWGWHSLASRVVGNLPKMLYDYLLHGAVPASKPVYGAKWIKWITDLPVCLHLLARGELSVKDYVNSLKGDLIASDWAASDPKPFLWQFVLLPYLMAKRGY